MAYKKVTKDIYINWLLAKIKDNNHAGRKDLAPLFCENFNVEIRTFDKFWKEAREKYQEIQNKISDKIEAAIETTAVEAAKRDVLSRIERLEIATKIARGMARQIGEEVFVPSDRDRLAALDYMSKIEGDYAPTKFAETDSKGNDKANTLTIMELSNIINNVPKH